MFTSAMSASKVKFCGFLIVDNADLLCNAPDNETTHEALLPRFQAMVDCWEENLRVTGGGINPDKSFWYLLDYRWDPNSGKWHYLTKVEAPAVVSIREPSSDARVHLQRLEPHKARMPVGV
jgi:hypothetical protein